MSTTSSLALEEPKKLTSPWNVGDVGRDSYSEWYSQPSPSLIRFSQTAGDAWCAVPVHPACVVEQTMHELPLHRTSPLSRIRSTRLSPSMSANLRPVGTSTLLVVVMRSSGNGG